MNQSFTEGIHAGIKFVHDNHIYNESYSSLDDDNLDSFNYTSNRRYSIY